jgi:hypothetical protein
MPFEIRYSPRANSEYEDYVELVSFRGNRMNPETLDL